MTTKRKQTPGGSTPSVIFDLDGTLVDTVYQHVLAWQEALERSDIEISVWRIHRRMGMSGGLFANALLRETGRPVSAKQIERIQKFHAEAYGRQAVRALPGAKELLAFALKRRVPTTRGGDYSFAPISSSILDKWIALKPSRKCNVEATTNLSQAKSCLRGLLSSSDSYDACILCHRSKAVILSIFASPLDTRPHAPKVMGPSSVRRSNHGYYATV